MRSLTLSLFLTASLALTSSAQQAQEALTNAGIESMVKAGVAEDVIVAEIDSSYCRFDTSAGAVNALKSAGVPAGVMLAMVRANASAAAAGTSAFPATGRRQAAGPLLLRDGTAVRLQLDETVSSASAHAGDSVALEAQTAVKVRGMTVISKGATALGTIAAVKRAGRLGRPGSISVSVNWVRDVDGNKVLLRAARSGSGGGRLGLMAGATAVTGLIFLPAAPAFLLMRGKDATIPTGTILTAFVDKTSGVAPHQSNELPRNQVGGLGAATPPPTPVPK